MPLFSCRCPENTELLLVKKKVDVKVPISHLNPVLPTHKHEPLTEFQQKALNLFEQAGLQLSHSLSFEMVPGPRENQRDSGL